MQLEALKEEIWQCNHCSMCTEMVCDEAGYYKVCPVYQIKEFENYTARGHNTIALYLLEGSLKYNRELAEVIFKCTTCKLCEEVCKPMGNAVAGLGGYGLKSVLESLIEPLNIQMNPIPSVAIMERMRADCVEQGLAPQGLQDTAERLARTGNTSGKPADERTRWTQGLDIPASAETILFVGDAAAYATPEVAQAAAKILRRAGMVFGVMPEERNSGAVMFRTGNLRLGESLARHNMRGLIKGVKEVVCLCAADYYSLVKDWPGAVGTLPFKVRHISSVLADLIRDRKIRLTVPVSLNVTYEDPCYLGRGMNIYADPRFVLRSIPGLRLSEMYPNAHAAWCCGSCGGVPESDPELAFQLGMRKLPLVEKTGASLIATACPEVKVHMQQVCSQTQNACQVQDIVELVAHSLGV